MSSGQQTPSSPACVQTRGPASTVLQGAWLPGWPRTRRRCPELLGQAISRIRVPRDLQAWPGPSEGPPADSQVLRKARLQVALGIRELPPSKQSAQGLWRWISGAWWAEDVY